MANTAPLIRSRRVTVYLEPAEKQALVQIAKRDDQSMGRTISRMIREEAHRRDMNIAPSPEHDD